MMLLIHVPEEYILGTTRLLFDETGAYFTQILKKDVPPEFIAKLKELNTVWKKAHNNHPYWIFPDDPDYEKYVALIK